jgi:hypothetical protein
MTDLTYKFRYRRRFFAKTRVVTGHRYDAPLEKMVLYFPDGTIEEIPEWKKYRLWLGTDWLLAQKKAMEREAGVTVPVRGT